MTPNELLRRFPNASRSTIEANCKVDDSELYPMQQQLIERDSLDCSSEREGSGTARFEISFEVYGFRIFDWDNYHVKEMQDCLVRAGILHADHGSILQGRIIPKKASKKEEEKTVITIERIA